jgi:hypothetical protein
MKKFTVVANSTIMDAEVRCRDLEEATAIYFAFKESGSYSNVYIMSNETGEIYRRYHQSFECGGIEIAEWNKLDL